MPTSPGQRESVCSPDILLQPRPEKILPPAAKVRTETSLLPGWTRCVRLPGLVRLHRPPAALPNRPGPALQNGAEHTRGIIATLPFHAGLLPDTIRRLPVPLGKVAFGSARDSCAHDVAVRPVDARLAVSARFCVPAGSRRKTAPNPGSPRSPGRSLVWCRHADPYGLLRRVMGPAKIGV